jgi:hypothetical protein
MCRALSLLVQLEELSRERDMLIPVPLTTQDNVTHRRIARQRLGKYACNARGQQHRTGVSVEATWVLV